MFRKVENLEKEFEKFKKSKNKMKEILKTKLIRTKFVEEEIIINVKYINARAERMMLIDSGAPKSIVSKKWLEGYLQDAKVSEEVVQGGSDLGKECM